MAQLTTIIEFLDSFLNIRDYRDSSLNGLQVQTSRNTVRKVAVAVDSGLSIIEQACKTGAELLIVHHGLFWGHEQPISGILGRKIELLMSNGCSLYSAHLPLDGNLEVGNGVELAKFFKLEQITGFCCLDGQFVGAQGVLQKPATIDDICQIGIQMSGATTPLVLPFGKKEIRKIGIVSGSGSMAIETCASSDIDLLISGEPKQSAYHLAKELCVNALFFGHYATETFGVRAVGKLLSERYEVESTFIDEPTGI